MYLSNEENIGCVAEPIQPYGRKAQLVLRPLGWGKTSQLLKDNNKYLFVIPATYLYKDIVANYDKTCCLFDGKGIPDCDKIFCSYERCMDAIRQLPGDYVVVFDECQELLNQYYFRNDALATILCGYIHRDTHNHIYMTATPTDELMSLLNVIERNNIVVDDNVGEWEDWDFFIYVHEQKGRIINFNEILSLNYDNYVFYINSKKEIADILARFDNIFTRANTKVIHSKYDKEKEPTQLLNEYDADEPTYIFTTKSGESGISFHHKRVFMGMFIDTHKKSMVFDLRTAVPQFFGRERERDAYIDYHIYVYNAGKTIISRRSEVDGSEVRSYQDYAEMDRFGVSMSGGIDGRIGKLFDKVQDMKIAMCMDVDSVLNTLQTYNYFRLNVDAKYEKDMKKCSRVEKNKRYYESHKHTLSDENRLAFGKWFSSHYIPTSKKIASKELKALLNDYYNRYCDIRKDLPTNIVWKASDATSILMERCEVASNSNGTMFTFVNYVDIDEL